jgi:hypothetical protein
VQALNSDRSLESSETTGIGVGRNEIAVSNRSRVDILRVGVITQRQCGLPRRRSKSQLKGAETKVSK